MKTCPFCAEDILDEAQKCKHCGEFLDPSAKADEPGRQFVGLTKLLILVVAVIVIVVALQMQMSEF